jgi:dipeptidase E
MPRRLLLISNSTNYGQGYLDHVLPEIDGFLGPVRRLVFVPFALKDREAYGEEPEERRTGDSLSDLL